MAELPRSELIDAYRQAQPLTELERKADKARRRQRIWTVEEIEAGMAKGAELHRQIRWE